jgi:glutathione peroxidase
MKASSVYDFEVQDLAGRKVKLSDYRGKVLLIVNTATACGLTPQLNGLQKLYEKYKERGFEVLGFPSAQFAGQEPRKGDAIQEFCEVNFGVGFKIMGKGKVKGDEAQPLFKYLAKETRQLFLRNNYPVWNFQKYLVDRNGKVVDYFIPWTLPNDDKIAAAIEKCLDEKAVETSKSTAA